MFKFLFKRRKKKGLIVKKVYNGGATPEIHISFK